NRTNALVRYRASNVSFARLRRITLLSFYAEPLAGFSHSVRNDSTAPNSRPEIQQVTTGFARRKVGPHWTFGAVEGNLERLTLLAIQRADNKFVAQDAPFRQQIPQDIELSRFEHGGDVGGAGHDAISCDVVATPNQWRAMIGSRGKLKS